MRLLFLAPFIALLLGGCAAFTYSAPPTVSVTSLSFAPQSEAAFPAIQVQLRVVNPNRASLPLVGMSYSLEIDDARILTGATSDLPEVPAYGSADVMVELAPDLIGSARLLTSLMSGRHDQLDFRFSARLDVGGWRPNIRIEESGRLELGGNDRTFRFD